MFFPIKIYLKDTWILSSLISAILMFFYIIFYVVRFIHPTGEQIFLHYNIIFGVDLIGVWWKMYLLPAVSFFIILVDFLISYLYYRHNRFISRLMAFTAAVLQVFLVIATVLIVDLNI